MKELYYHKFDLAKHTYILAATEKGLAFVGSMDQSIDELEAFYPQVSLVDDIASVEKYFRQISEYLNGQRKNFSIKLDISGTDFQEAVWQQLQKIPYGEVKNYTQIAEAIGQPKAYRAVGSAIGKNPVLMVIPCHRVVTKEGNLGGYRGGLKMKQELLALEKNS